MLKILNQPLFICGGFVCCVSIPDSTGNYVVQSFWKRVSYIVFLVFDIQLFCPYSISSFVFGSWPRLILCYYKVLEVIRNPVVHCHCSRDTWTVPKYTVSSHLYLGLVPVGAPDLSFNLFHCHHITFPAPPFLNHQLLCWLLVGNHHLHHTVFINTLF
jgi:hypothetical protein